MSPDTPIDDDLPCRNCEYNLRGLTVVHRCPECGYPALRSVIRAAVQIHPFPADAAVIRVAYNAKALELLPKLLDVPAEAVRSVQAAAGYRQRPGKPVHRDARQFCAALVAMAAEQFGGREAGLARLREWKLERGPDVGRVVAALVEAGLISASERDDPAEFKTIGSLDQLPAGV